MMFISRNLRAGIDLFNSKKILFFLLLFLLVLPKGGIKIAEIPITWGYLLIGIISLFILFRGRWVVQNERLEALICLLPFQIISGATLLIFGFETTSWAISFLISFFLLPCVFLLLLSKSIEEMDLQFFLKIFKWGIVLISYYGIALFIYKQITGTYFEVPLITMNLGDMGTLDTAKCNSRGIVSKLISTYNNGLLFGISLTILLPLYSYVQKNPWHKLATQVALILTLSRTAWIGLVFSELALGLFVSDNRWRSLMILFVKLLVLSCICAAILSYYGFGISFLFDSNLGGRRVQLELLEKATFFPYKPFSYIAEMTYLGVLDSFGIIGVVAYLIGLGGPILFYLKKGMSKIRMCLILGLLDYLFISVSDGAIHYIPVLAFYWFCLALMTRKNLEVSTS